MTTFDFFVAGELPAPVVSTEEATRIAAEHFGLDATAEPLGSQQDANFLLRSPHGAALGVLKIANPAFSLAEIEAQDAAARHVAEAESGIRTAHNAGPSGRAAIARVELDGREPLFARILAYLDGGSLSGDHYVAPQRWAALGTLTGRASRALARFEAPGVDRVLQWDLQHADRAIDLLLPFVNDPARRTRIAESAQRAWNAVRDIAAALPVQVIHCDITDDNVVCTPDGDREPDGIIDFGDLTRSWAVGELAVAVSSVLRHAGGEPAAALPLIAAFHRERPLSAVEAQALWPLVVLRAATLVVSGNQQAAIDADNDYATEALEFEWQIFERSTDVPAEVMTALITRHLGLAGDCDRPTAETPLLPAEITAAAVRLDLGTESDLLDGGRWLDPGVEDDLARAVLRAGARAAATHFGLPRLTRSVALHSESPATVPTGVDVWLPAPTSLRAPVSAFVRAVGETEIVLAADTGTLHLRGEALSAAVEVGHAVSAGAEIAVAAGRIWVQALIGDSAAVPAFVRPEYAPGWLALVVDPSGLLGLEDAAPAEIEAAPALAARRGATLAAVQEQYYREPPRIERGWREFLLDTDGRSHLDMVNNVAAIGHGHPRLADAVARQWRRLNTNSRFNYGAVVEFSERLAATLPDPLDTVFLVNSGSEAVDLALRLAFAATGRSDVVAVAEAYHGWTYATDAISTSVADNPNALSTRPDWVHTVPSPNSFRGEHRGDDAWRYAPEAVSIIEGLVAQGHPPAALICEPFYGNAGGIALPDGYLDAVYRAVRAAGGVAIADEVQVGYGRLGTWFWGFQGQGVVPDIVTVAKAMGNGQPLGAVITTRDIAAAYRTQGYFFSSAGGSPVSSVVGLTVLDVIEQEGLQRNAAVVGDHLKARLAELADRHPLIGAVHGSGLYMGVELVRDRTTLEPAVAETAGICERLRELGVIVQPTGDHQNVLKMKPPMCLSQASADFFADMLDRVLTTGW
ncbi:4-aminobutyrate aminotransferase [Mycolicibacterium confluentis]|nr:aminotransferase [Mycolicibacterium confluentis]MCV7321931.1 aminotransferase [Mycolicibacterium confluentis]ORV32317.1 4-aminobutyrate aminotransferase [Mycolicibacterium confluentis]